eukprot:Awhi_evm1s10150
MLNISRKNKISWIVSCTIYAFFFMILFPFLILSVVTELNKTYDLYSIGVEGSSVALSLSPSSNTYKNAFETTLSVLTKESSNSLSISKDTMEMTAHNLTSDLAASLVLSDSYSCLVLLLVLFLFLVWSCLGLVLVLGLGLVF